MSRRDPLVPDLDFFVRRNGKPGRMPAGGSGRGQRHRRVQMWRRANGSNSAVIKRIHNGGTHHPRQLAGQMAYVNGKAVEVFGNGIDVQDGAKSLDEDAVVAMIDDWSAGWKGNPRNGHTTHLVVSFPVTVTNRQALEITREWCAEMFEDGPARGVDTWSYYAAQHTDRAHPHVHIIVNNRGHDGDWFYMAKGHDFSYDYMRERLVELAEPHGVILDSTSRLERGIIEYAPSSAEVRRAQRLGREPAHRVREGAALAAARERMMEYAEECRGMAKLADVIDHEDTASMLREAAVCLENGQPFQREGAQQMEIDVNQHPVDIRDAVEAWEVAKADKIAALAPEDRKVLRAQISKTLDHIEGILDPEHEAGSFSQPPATRVYGMPFAEAALGDRDRLEARALEYGAVPEEVEQLLEDGGFARYAISGDASEIPPEFEAAAEALKLAHEDYSSADITVGAEAMSRILKRAEAVGIDPVAMQSRMEIGADDEREEVDWMATDIKAIIAHNGWDNADQGRVDEAVAIATRIYEFAEDVIDDLFNYQVEIDHARFEAASVTIVKEMRAYKTTVFDSRDDEVAYLRAFRAHYGQDAIERLAQGKIEVVSDLASEPQAQRDIAFTVFRLAQKHPEVGIEQEAVEAGMEAYNPAIWYGHGQDGHSI